MPKRRANGEGNIRKRKDGRWEDRCAESYPLDQQKRRTAGRKVGHQYTENVKFHPNSAAPRGNSKTSRRRT